MQTLPKLPLKYRNKPTIVDGFRFDSKREAARYAELKLLEQAGDIRNIKIHPLFVLLPSFSYAGKQIRGVSYEADFQYEERYRDPDWPCLVEGGCWKTVVEDVKGTETEAFKLKWKFVKSQNTSIDFRLIK